MKGRLLDIITGPIYSICKTVRQSSHTLVIRLMFETIVSITKESTAKTVHVWSKTTINVYMYITSSKILMSKLPLWIRFILYFKKWLIIDECALSMQISLFSVLSIGCSKFNLVEISISTADFKKLGSINVIFGVLFGCLYSMVWIQKSSICFFIRWHLESFRFHPSNLCIIVG